MLIGSLAAMTTGVFLPLFSILSGDLLGTFDPENSP